MKVKLLTIALLICSLAQAQEEGVKKESRDEESLKGAHRLTFGLGHTHISEGKVDGKTQWLATASTSLNYDYWISNKWAAGLQTDLIMETFKIEANDQEEIERSFPLAVVPVGIFKPGKHWSFVGGAGVEFSKGHNIGLTRLGIEYGHQLPKGWEVGAAFVWDNKWNYYNSWGIAITISRVWERKER